MVFDKLSGLTKRGFVLLLDYEDELKKLEKMLLRVKSILFETKGSEVTTKVVRFWSQHLKEVIDDAMDLLDEIEMNSTYNITRAHKVRKVRENIDNILKEVEGIYSRNLFEVRERLQTNPLVDISIVIDRSLDKFEVFKLLIANEKKDFVIYMVGVMGVRKTELVKIVYNNEEVIKHFDLRAWVSVPANLDVRKLIKMIIEFATGRAYYLVDLNSLQVVLRNMLWLKRFLLVLDGIWDESFRDWEAI